MQRQKGTMGSLEHASSDSGAVEKQICWTNFMQNPSVDANQETENLSLWSHGESSSNTVSNRVDPKNVSLSNAVEPPTSRLSLGNNGYRYQGDNVTVNPSTFIGMKNSNYASSSSGPVEMEARQLPRKRKAPELNTGQSSSGSGSSSNVWQSVLETPTLASTISFDPIIPRLNTSDDRSMETARRNVRTRLNTSRQQDQLPASNNNNNNGLLSFSSPYTSFELNPLATTVDNSSSSREGQPMLRASALTRNRSSSSRANRPVTSRTTPINVLDRPLFVRPQDIGSTAQTAINLDLDSASGPTPLSSTSNPTPDVGLRRGSSLYHSRRHAELVRRSFLSSNDLGAGGDGSQIGNLFSRLPPPVGTSASSSQEPGIPPAFAFAGHHPRHHLRHLRTLDRHLDGAFGFPYLARTVTGGSERRGRLVSELRSVLDLMRRGEGLRFEDFMILDQSVFYGLADVHDRHRDMRLDIDNMSYEELLALEERIGNVNTGLTEENVYKHLKQKTYASMEGQPDDEPCCICQEEYKNGDDLGALECGHEFHTSCIKQWLLQKNACPVCKSAAAASK